ncbi:unnamed protein product [Staurois parvus]|uniref:Uncharacterized protein n=1 Tax=Staurois parvus TaxID=386267 RepID=A0ABN9CE64_9NEOB|nr:unnamed protein product [Staurois parvus]
MTVLPKLLYYFRTLPVRVPPHFLRLLQAKFMRFIWANKHPRVSRNTLFAHRLQGGLGVPNVTKYYQASQIVPLSMLHASSDVPLWVLLELPNCAPIQPSALLWLPPALRPISLSPMLLHGLRVWDSVRYSSGLMSPFLPLLPIVNNPLFPPGLDHPRAFSWWVAHGFSQVRHFFLVSRSFPTWDLLRESRDVPPAEFF